MKYVFVWILTWKISYWIRRLSLFKVMRRPMMSQRRLHWLTRRKYGLFSSTSPSWQNSAIIMSGRTYQRSLWDQLSQRNPIGHLPSLAKTKMLTESFQLNQLLFESSLEAVWIGSFLHLLANKEMGIRIWKLEGAERINSHTLPIIFIVSG